MRRGWDSNPQIPCGIPVFETGGIAIIRPLQIVIVPYLAEFFQRSPVVNFELLLPEAFQNSTIWEKEKTLRRRRRFNDDDERRASAQRQTLACLTVLPL